MPTVEEVMQGARDVMTVRRVFGEPVEKGEITFVPVASVRGGGGGGGGESPDKGETGNGAGFGVTARPIGAYVIRGDSVEWQPALDVARVALAAIALVAFMTFVLGRAVRRRG